MDRSRVGRALTVVVAITIITATVVPVSSDETTVFQICLICGQRGAADALMNALLFLPLGLALALWGGWAGRGGRAIGVALLLSTGIECVQTFIPGRHSTIGDIVFNTLGAAAGVMLLRMSGVLLAPGARTRRWLFGIATAMAPGIVLATGLLLAPAFPPSTYFGQWTPDLGHLAHYRGDVLEFSIGSMKVSSGRLARSDSVRVLLARGSRLRARAIAGAPTERLASLVSIYDHRYREIVLVGPDRDALVYRRRTQAAAWRLDQPDYRLPGAFARLAAGDTFEVVVEPRDDGHCLSLARGPKADPADEYRSCGLGPTAGSGWSLLYHIDSLAPWLLVLLNGAWLAVLAIPGAFWASARSALLLHAGLLLFGLALAPLLTALVATPLSDFAGAAAGIAIGGMLGRYGYAASAMAPGPE